MRQAAVILIIENLPIKIGLTDCKIPLNLIDFGKVFYFPSLKDILE